MKILRKISIFLLSFLFMGAGLLHFLNPAPFAAIVPSYLPAPLALVYVSGFFEILGSIGLQLSRFRQSAGYGLIALLLAVFPANVYMLTDHPYLMQTHVSAWILWLRLPLQFLLMTWIWWVARPQRSVSKR